MTTILPRAVRDLSQELMRLPSVGPKTARRLAIHLLRQPPNVVINLADKLKNLHDNVSICENCYNLSEKDVCEVCNDIGRDKSIICVVENPLDVEAIERTASYDGVYHVLGGVLSPLEGIGEEHLTINELVARIDKGEAKELIMALNPTVEGEATIRYIIENINSEEVKISRLARGLPTGGDIEYADATTIKASIEGRKFL